MVDCTSNHTCFVTLSNLLSHMFCHIIKFTLTQSLCYPQIIHITTIKITAAILHLCQFFCFSTGCVIIASVCRKKLMHMQINQPNGDKLKMWARKLRSGVNWQGVLKQKYVKQGLSVQYCSGPTISTILSFYGYKYIMKLNWEKS